MKTLIAYHNDPKIKTKYLKRVRAHRAADELVKGVIRGRTRNGFKGCAVVCTLERYDHAAYETELGIPESLAQLEDGIFEGLPEERSQLWPEQFLAVIPVGANLGRVTDQFLYWLLADKEDGVIRVSKSGIAREAVQKVADLYQRKLNGENVAKEEWIAAANAANAAFFSAAKTAANAAFYAANAAFYATNATFYAAKATNAAIYAADAANAAAKATNAIKLSRTQQADKLLELLSTAPMALNRKIKTPTSL